MNHSEEFAQNKEHSELVNKYYAITALFENNIRKCATAIRAAGCTERPSFVFKDLEYLWISKYSEQIDKLYRISKNDDSAKALVSYVKYVYMVSKKHGFKPDDEVKKGDLIGESEEDIDITLIKFVHKIKNKYSLEVKHRIELFDKPKPLTKEERLS